MQRDGEHVAALVKDFLHAVAVMRVHVQIDHALAGAGQRVAGQRHVVEITEAARVRRHGMMKTAQQVERDVRLARDEQVRRHKARAAGPGAVFEHVLEHRRVRSAQAHAKTLHRQIPRRGALKFFEVVRGMNLPQLGGRGLAGSDLRAIRPAQQTKRSELRPGERRALGLERAIRRVTQPFDLGRIHKGESAVVHGGAGGAEVGDGCNTGRRW